MSVTVVIIMCWAWCVQGDELIVYKYHFKGSETEVLCGEGPR